MKTRIEEQKLDEFGRKMLADPFLRRKESDQLRTRIAQYEHDANRRAEFIPDSGISVIVATHRGEDRIEAMLESLSRQTLQHDRFEVIIVENGESRGVAENLERYRGLWPSLAVRYFYLKTASAGAARNLGVDLARYSRTTFLDDDDQIGREFLREALSLSTGTNVVISPIVNVNPEGQWVADNPLNVRVANLHRAGSTRIVDASWALGFNACKLVPTWMIRDLRFDEDLKSGEDLVFWAQLVKRPSTELVAVRPDPDSAYFRVLREESISRRPSTFEFAVSERLDCISALEKIKVAESTDASRCLKQLAQSQAGFIGRYIDANPNERDRVIESIQDRTLRAFPWSVLNSGTARDLAFVYCFAPFSDTSAVVAAKAIAERERIVDVISNDMSTVRRLDTAVSALADRWIDKRTMVDSRPSFAGWEQIADFAEKAVAIADRDHALKGPYETVYSRALWIGSHVAASLFKLRHWNVKWTAEFSDPLRRDAEGNARIGEVGSGEAWSKLLEGVRSRGYVTYVPNTVFDLVEVATFVLADELIFTNRNQLAYMLSLTEDVKLRDVVRDKAIIREHPKPGPRAYEIVQTDYIAPPEMVNIAYFGSFYPNRGIGDVLVALSNMKDSVRRKIRLHIFSNKSDDVRAETLRLGVGPLVYTQGYLSYMEFLNATRAFDVLLVNDVERSENLRLNPFLPSKYSDYVGSGSDIWALVDEGSPLASKNVAFQSPVGNSAAIMDTLESIAQRIPKGDPER